MKNNNIYIATDKNGVTRISDSLDPALASSKWRMTKSVCIYSVEDTDEWWGSCRMSSQARSSFYKMRMNDHFDYGKAMSLDKAVELFAKKLAEYTDLKSTKPSPPQDDDLLVGYWEDEDSCEGLAVSYKGVNGYVLETTTGLPPAFPCYSKNCDDVLVLWQGDKCISIYPFKNSGREENKVLRIVMAIDEALSNEERKKHPRKSFRGSRASTKADRRAGR